MTIAELNRSSKDQALAVLLECCGSRVWAIRMVESRPFVDRTSLQSAAGNIWWSLSEPDWLEAFSRHPKIGERSPSAGSSSHSTEHRSIVERSFSAEEQRGMLQASGETASLMDELNRTYEARFGYIFIICAAGRPASEMLAALESRLSNAPKQELHVAAAEQAKIMHLRLDKCLAE
jgi:2-oxo-4-hydroxy-4-carboxy-5-ureidoimidazoline decarboxylase